jgi:hypothetical protein
MRLQQIGYWTTTIVLAFFVGTGGIAYVLQSDFALEGFVILGLPAYVMVLIGVWKIAGSIAILVPGIPRIKEWAYAGLFFDVTGAIVAHAAVGDYGVYAYHIVINVVFAVLIIASWALRPQQRLLGDLRTV